MVFYFTAARSSLYAAKQPDPEPVSISQVFGRPGRPSAVCGARDGGRAGASAADSFRKPGAAGRAVERHLPGNRTLRRLRDLYKGVSCRVHPSCSWADRLRCCGKTPVSGLYGLHQCLSAESDYHDHRRNQSLVPLPESAYFPSGNHESK